MQIKDIVQYLESIAPSGLQESYDNAGLLTGSLKMEVKKVLISLDITPQVMDEAVKTGSNLIITHHPLVFKSLKKLSGGNLVEDMLIQAIKHDIALFATHTNLDNVWQGVNGKLAQIIGLKNPQILSPKPNLLKKLVVFCPQSHTEKVRQAILDAGAGHIGNYSHCSFSGEGFGSFKALEGAHPYVGDVGSLHYEPETRIETIVPQFLLAKVQSAMLKAHPYEEVAYDVYPLENSNPQIGAGMIGSLEKPTEISTFLQKLKIQLNAQQIRHGILIDKKVTKVAICGGSGSFLMQEAYRQGADVFVTADLKYHDFFNYQGKMTLVDAGHYETEQFAKDLLFELLSKKFPTFAIQKSKFNTNPISFL
jgi:dinuclear metal center YbgI/SA1388 family protein